MIDPSNTRTITTNEESIPYTLSFLMHFPNIMYRPIYGFVFFHTRYHIFPVVRVLFFSSCRAIGRLLMLVVGTPCRGVPGQTGHLAFREPGASRCLCLGSGVLRFPACRRRVHSATVCIPRGSAKPGSRPSRRRQRSQPRQYD